MRPAMTDTLAEPAPGPQKQAKSETADFLQFLLKLAIFVFILRSFIVAPFSIPSESMLPRLLIGDYLLVAKWPYGYSRHSLPWSVPLIPGPGRVFSALPERGDVVVFKAPPGDRTDYIKRVIGLPGDLIQMRGGQVILNGTPVPKRRIADFVIPASRNMIDETRRKGADFVCSGPDFEEAGGNAGRQCRFPRFRETLPNGKSYNVIDLGPTGADDTQVFTVPAGQLFLMGDNRDRSADSRFSAMEGGGIGLVPIENLVGKALVSVFSTDGSANWFLPWTWFTAARWQRIGEGF